MDSLNTTRYSSNFKFNVNQASLSNKSEQKLKSSNLNISLDVHTALTRGCRLTKPQINADGLHFSALAFISLSTNEITVQL